ncbi:hypothetical protein HNY73_022779 [Argiope bruennichi]|uniref:Uncharacterized protein n=1 Tax=Argiope bruennichi TaxID=94029 RepID=A0A8T0E394_ARGBR|nr:hypothetical protein HNY73_022779 [Argiope bruennichi]
MWKVSGRGRGAQQRDVVPKNEGVVALPEMKAGSAGKIADAGKEDRAKRKVEKPTTGDSPGNTTDRRQGDAICRRGEANIDSKRQTGVKKGAEGWTGDKHSTEQIKDGRGGGRDTAPERIVGRGNKIKVAHIGAFLCQGWRGKGNGAHPEGKTRQERSTERSSCRDSDKAIAKNNI